ncbi:tape measure protein [Lonepinella sp. MS14436]|uniref:tape measure protein n=1 Tax=Lonepinella sp. MS14436 TaxID=3003619 RepID=UPI0036DF6C96
MASFDRFTIDLDINNARFNTTLQNAQNRLRSFNAKTVSYLNDINNAANAINRNTNFTFFTDIASRAGGAFSMLGQYADGYTEISNRLKLVESAGIDGAKGLQAVFDIAMQTNQSVESTSTIYQRFAQNAKNLGINQAEVAELTETVSKAVAVSGASASAASAALMQFGQALASGELRGQELNSVMEQTPGLAQAIANGLGVSVGALKEMGKKGELSIGRVIDALKKAKDGVDNQFATRVLTISAAFENLSTATTKWVGELDQATGASQGFANVISGIPNHFNTLALAATTAIGAFSVDRIKQHIVAGNEQARTTLVAAEAETVRTNALRTEATAEMNLLQLKLTQARTDAERIAIINQLSAAETRLTATINAEAVAQRNLATAQKAVSAGGRLVSGALGLVGGPIGAVSIALAAGVGMWLDYSQKTEEAHKNALAFANDLPSLTAEMEKLNSVQLAANKAKIEESIIAQQKEVKNLEKAIKDLETQILKTPKLDIIIDENGYQIEIDNTTKITQLNRELAKAKGELQTAQEKLNTTQETGNKIASQLATTTQNELDNAISHLRTVFGGADTDLAKFNQSMLTVSNTAENTQSPLSGMIERLLSSGNAARVGASGLYEFANAAKAIAGKGIPYALGNTTVAGDEKQKAYLENLQTQNKINNAKTRDEYISLNVKKDLDSQGIGANNELYAKAYAELESKYSKQWDSQHKSTSGGKGKSTENARQNWLSYYDDIRKKSSSSLMEIDLEQARMFQRLEEHLKKGVVSHQEYETAKTAITERFAKQRQELAGKYAPEKLLKSQLADDLNAIRELQQAGELNPAEAQKATQRVQIDYAQQKAQYAVDPLAQIRAKYDPNQEIQNQQTQELAQLQAFYDQKLIAEDEFQQRKSEVIANYQNEQEQRELDYYSQSAQTMSSAFDTMASVAENYGGKQSALYKSMFAVSKAFAIADSAIKIQQGIADAAALPYPENLAAMANVAAATANIISTIQSVSMSFATGGYTGDGGKYDPAGVVHKGEYVITKEATARLGKNYLDYLNYGKRGFANGGGVGVPTLPNSNYSGVGNGNRVSVQIINNGEPVSASVRSEQNGDELQITVELMKQMDKIADQRYRKNQQNDMRSGGMMNR